MFSCRRLVNILRLSRSLGTKKNKKNKKNKKKFNRRRNPVNIPQLSPSLGTKKNTKKSNPITLDGLNSFLGIFISAGGALWGYYMWSADNTNKRLATLAEEFAKDVSMFTCVLIWIQ